jgi:hypothetical protein
MNWVKIAAVVLGAIIVFLVLGSVVHFVLSILGAVVFLAILGGGGYVAYKMVRGARRREIRRGGRY